MAGKIQRRLLLSIAVVWLVTIVAALVAVLLRPGLASAMGVLIFAVIAAPLGAVGGCWVGMLILGDALQSLERVENSLDEYSRSGSLAPAGLEGSDAQPGALVPSYDNLVNRFHETESSNLDFLGRIAHDLRSPVASIVAHAELFSEPTFRQDQVYLSQCAEVFTRQGRQVVQFLEDIQAMISVEKHRSDLVRAPFHISQMIEQVVAEASEKAQRKICFENHAGDPIIVADAMLIREALLQLLDNSVKYSPPESPICVLLDNSATQGWIEVSIQDCGIGIDESEKKLLFRAFGRVKNQRTSGIPGSGLGLFTVNKIIRYSKGKISIESQPDRGSTFTISLPLQ